MALRWSWLPFRCSTLCPREEPHHNTFHPSPPRSIPPLKSSSSSSSSSIGVALNLKPSSSVIASASKALDLVLGDGKDDEGSRKWSRGEGNRHNRDGSSSSSNEEEEDDDDDDDGPLLMSPEEREEMRRKIRKVLDASPDVEEETDPAQRRLKMQKLLEDYPLVVEEEDTDWPEDADGWGFNLDQFFNKITIKNNRKDDDDVDDGAGYDSEKEIEWKDDDYIRPIREITAREWEDIVFKDFNPLIILVHNRYKRPRENERARNELEKAVQLFWETGLPAPRCAAIDACTEHELVEALNVSIFPEILFTKAGKILHRDKVRTADEWSKIMAFFYYKAVRPSCLSKTAGQSREKIPALS